MINETSSLSSDQWPSKWNTLFKLDTEAAYIFIFCYDWFLFLSQPKIRNLDFNMNELPNQFDNDRIV